MRLARRTTALLLGAALLAGVPDSVAKNDAPAKPDTAAKSSSGAWVCEINVTASAHCSAAFSLSVKMSPASRHADTSIIFSTATPAFSRSRECMSMQ